MNHPPSETVAEIQGYYGSLHIAERVIQELWEKQDFDTSHLITTAGDEIRVLDPGKWNHHEGPDFKSATIRIGDKTLTGDVELHLYPEDWRQHGHTRDPGFSQVILHVTLFDSRQPVELKYPGIHLVLLPYLRSDLEGLLTHYAFSKTIKPDPSEEAWVASLLAHQKGDSTAQHQLILEKSLLRWHLKRQFAKDRIRCFGWDEACHQYMLEVLGYRRNRSVMHRISLEWPLSEMAKGWHPETVFENHRGEWKLQGIRPANQPFRRLQSYHRLTSVAPDWPQRLLQFFESTGLGREATVDSVSEPENISVFRNRLKIHNHIRSMKEEILNGEPGGTRFHTLSCDALIPLYSALTETDFFPLWFVWLPGDFPELLSKVIRLLPFSQLKGAANCNGWMQGCLQLALEGN